jgi:hypothetical protein
LPSKAGVGAICASLVGATSLLVGATLLFVGAFIVLASGVPEQPMSKGPRTKKAPIRNAFRTNGRSPARTDKDRDRTDGRRRDRTDMRKFYRTD